MTDSWDRTVFEKELKSLLESKLPVSASKITSLQSLAIIHPKHHNFIVQCITRFIERAPPDYRLAGLYVIDAISRAVHKQQRKREENGEGPHETDGYLKRFAIVLKDDSMNGCFEPCLTKDKEKVKKTLDFWEQGNVYPKETVQYIKSLFLNSGSVSDLQRHKEKVISPPVDTASLLATLSSIGNGALANITIPGITPPPVTTIADSTESEKALPPALAKLLGGLVSTPSPPATIHSPTLSNDPRLRSNSNNDPRQRPVDWSTPQGSSITPSKPVTERKSRWGSANDNTATTTTNNFQPPPVRPVVQTQDPWAQRQAMQDSRLPNNYQQQAPPVRQQQQQSYPYQNQPQSFQDQQQPYQQPSYRPPPPQQQQQQQQYHSSYQQQRVNPSKQPIHDPSLPPRCIKVLTRTLFIGPIPDHYEKEDVEQIFSKYGQIASVIVSKRPKGLKGRHNAFLKFTTRAATEAAKYDCVNLVVENVLVKVNWAFGFGPKKHFNYDRGDSIIPLSELSDEEKDNLMTAPVGGFHGMPVLELMTIEEPEAAYRPEWKQASDSNNNRWNDNSMTTIRNDQQQQHGFKRTGANFEEINTRKRNRFDVAGSGDNNMSSSRYGGQHSPNQYNNNNDFRYNNNNSDQSSPIGRDDFYTNNNGQDQQQHYSDHGPSIPIDYANFNGQ